MASNKKKKIKYIPEKEADLEQQLNQFPYDTALKYLFIEASKELTDFALDFLQRKDEIILERLRFDPKFKMVLDLELDYFYQFIVDAPYKVFFHSEVQSTNHPKMPQRVCMYYMAIDKDYCGENDRIIQIVFYIGKEPLNMPDTFCKDGITIKIVIIDFKKLKSDYFMKFDSPGMFILALLTETDDYHELAKEVLNRIYKLPIDLTQLNLYLKIVDVCASLRDERETIFKVKEDMGLATEIIKNDTVYLKGIAEGKKTGKIEGRLEGKLEGKQEYLATLVYKKFHVKKKPMSDIADDLEISVEEVKEYLKYYEDNMKGNVTNNK